MLHARPSARTMHVQSRTDPHAPERSSKLSHYPRSLLQTQITCFILILKSALEVSQDQAFLWFFLNDSSSRVDLGGGTATRHSKSRSFFSFLSLSTPTRDLESTVVETSILILSVHCRSSSPLSRPAAVEANRPSGILVSWLTPQNRLSKWKNSGSYSLSTHSSTPKDFSLALVVR